MMRMKSGPKKRSPRYPIKGTFEGSESSALPTGKKPVVFRGQVKDISDGGFCLIAARRPQQSVMIRGVLKLAQMPAKIPTLVRVRWVDRQLKGQSYRIGLEYLI